MEQNCNVYSHNGIKLEISNRIIAKKITKYLEIKQLLNNVSVKQEVSREIFKYLELNENATTTYQSLAGCSESSA